MAVKQLDPEVLLQTGDVGRDRWLTDTQKPGSGSHAAAAGGGIKGPKFG
jgi:hypothetical protein